MLYPGCPHIFTGLEYSGASVRGHTYFPVVQCTGLQYTVLWETTEPLEITITITITNNVIITITITITTIINITLTITFLQGYTLQFEGAKVW